VFDWFSVITGVWIVSAKYNSGRDGIAMDTGMFASATVLTVSIVCPSRINRLDFLH
jgi:hypothetical protein